MSKKILITGGAGFIGVNTAEYYLKKNNKVTIFDNFSRGGTRENVLYLKSRYKNLTVLKGNIASPSVELQKAVSKSDIVFHFAGQVAVTTSIDLPVQDFKINALGTLNLLELVRKSSNKPILVYSSTNKVYGDLEHAKVLKNRTRYTLRDLPHGVAEDCNLDFHSPYGCSKGTADQYVRDYARIYGLRTIVFRQSCIYGPHQFGMADQGWIAWFILALLENKKITIYGDGKQVRDILYIDDLVRAYDLAIKKIKVTSGQVYNIGGGIKNSISIWTEFKPILENLFGKKIKTSFGKWRAGDQKIYVSDIRKAKKDFGWTPKIDVETGIHKTFTWLKENRGGNKS